MKIWLPTALLILTSAPLALAQQAPPPPPPTVLVQAPQGAQRDGPFRLLVAAKVDARERRAHGYRADVVFENGMWYVVCYP